MNSCVAALIERGEMNLVEREVDPKFELAAVISQSQKTSDRPRITYHEKNAAPYTQLSSFLLKIRKQAFRICRSNVARVYSKP